MGNVFHGKKVENQSFNNSNNITFAWQSEDIKKEKMREEMDDPLMSMINLKRMGQDYRIFASKEKTNFYKCFSEGQQGFYYATEKHTSKKTLFVIKKWDPFVPQKQNLANDACYLVDENKSQSPPKLYFLPFIVRINRTECEIDRFIQYCKEKDRVSSEFDQESVRKFKNVTYKPDIVLMDPTQKKYVYTWYELRKKYGAQTQTGARLTDTLSTLAMFYPEMVSEFLTMNSYVGSRLRIKKSHLEKENSSQLKPKVQQVKKEWTPNTNTNTNIGAMIQMKKKETKPKVKQNKIGSNGNDPVYDWNTGSDDGGGFEIGDFANDDETMENKKGKKKKQWDFQQKKNEDLDDLFKVDLGGGKKFDFKPSDEGYDDMDWAEGSGKIDDNNYSFKDTTAKNEDEFNFGGDFSLPDYEW